MNCYFCGKAFKNQFVGNKYQSMTFKCHKCRIKFNFLDQTLLYISMYMDNIYIYTIFNQSPNWDEIYNPGKSGCSIFSEASDLPDYYLCNNNPKEVYEKFTKKLEMVKVFK